MTRFSIKIALAVCMPILLAASLADGQCDGERWPVKVGLDSDVGLVNLNAITQTTIGDLTAIAQPSTLPDENRLQPTETTTWVLNATLVKYAQSFDSDYHMVFRDGAGRTMIGEIPDPDCVDASSPFRSGIAHARAQFDAMFSATSNFQTTNTLVRITGVGFFDYFEGQEGYASNGIELHPIIDIQFGPVFSLAASPNAVNVPLGGSASTTVSTSIFNGFSSSIALSASGLPSGMTPAFSPSSIAAPGNGSSVLTLTAGASAQAGTYNVTVTGSGGGKTVSTTINVTVTQGPAQLIGNAGFENGASNPAPWSASSGVIDSSSFMAPHAGSWKAWLNGFGTTHTDTLSQQVTIPAGATSATLSYWKHIETVENKGKANDTLKVQIRNTGGAVLGTLVTYSNLNSASGYSKDTFDLLAYKGQTVRIYIEGVENSSLKTSFVFDDFALSVTTTQTSNPDFSVSTAPASMSIAAGGSGQSTVTTSISGGFNSAVSLAVSGMPSGVTAALAPASIAAPGGGNSTMTVTAGSSAAAGTYPIQITATGGGLTRSTTLSITITSTSGGTTTQLLGNAGFENGSTNPSPWSVTAGVIDNNAVQPPHQGLWKAWLNGYGTTHTDTLYQQVSIPANATKASLSFWRHIETTETTTATPYDTLKIQIRNSSGTVLATLATYSNLSSASGYAQTTFDLLSYKGQTIQVYLIGVEDPSLKTSFVFDDFALSVTTP